jgi:RNA ligase
VTTASEVIDVDELMELVSQGFVRIGHHPDDDRYLILSYTKMAVGHEWTPTLRECRGLILLNDQENLGDAKVLARPFAKFFNAHEPEASWLEELGGSTKCLATDKNDGSLGVGFIAPDGEWAIATRGSFASEQAVHATKILRTRYRDAPMWMFTGADISDATFTPLYEIVYPDNRIVIDYGDMDDLVFLGLRSIGNGGTYVPFTPENWWPGPHAEVLSDTTLADALALPDRENREGMVLHVQVSGLDWRMVKVKQEDYVRLHRIVTGLSERTVWERYDELGYGEAFHWFATNVDTEHADWACTVLDRIQDGAYAHEDWAKATADLFHVQTDNRGDFARKVNASISDKNLRAGVFLAYDNNLDRLNKWANLCVRPSGNSKIGSPVGREVSE